MWKLDNWDQENYASFIDFLKQQEDLKYLAFNKGLLPGVENMIGIRTPKLWKIAKEIQKGNAVSYLACVQKLYNKDFHYEEIMIEGMVIGYLSQEKQASPVLMKEHIGNFAPKINNWAVCDICCGGMKIIKIYPEEFWEFILNYVESKEEYKVRMGIVLLMNYYLEEEYIDEVLQCCDSIDTSYHYISMAVAWLISMAFNKFEDKTMQFLKVNHLSKNTYNKALQKIIESRCVTKDKKDIIRSMKLK